MLSAKPYSSILSIADVAWPAWLEDLFMVCKKSYRLIAITTLVFFLGATLYLYFSPARYQADALIERLEKPMEFIPGVGFSSGGVSSSHSDVELINSRSVLNKVIEDLKLDVSITPQYSFWGKVSALFSSTPPNVTINKFEIPLSFYSAPLTLQISGHSFSLHDFDNKMLLQGKLGQLARHEGIELLISSYQGKEQQAFRLVKTPKEEVIEKVRASLSVKEKDGLLPFSFTAVSPKEAERILNEIIKVYASEQEGFATRGKKQESQFLQEQYPRLDSELKKDEDDFSNFRSQKGLLHIEGSLGNWIGRYSSINEELKRLQFKENELAKRVTKNHPLYITLLDKRKSLLEEQALLTKKLRDVPEEEKTYFDLLREVMVKEELATTLLSKKETLNLSTAGIGESLRVIDWPEAPRTALNAGSFLLVSVVSFVGLLFGCLLAKVKSLIFMGIREPAKIEALGLSVYASIPFTEKQVSQVDNEQKPFSLLAKEDPTNLSIEALRSLRSGLSFLSLKDNKRVIVLTGPSPGIGKSFVSANLSAVIAATEGARVLVIDTDMRKGTLEKYFSLESAQGLSEYLSDEAPFEQVLKETSVNNLKAITRGKAPDNPSELLMSPRFIELLDQARENFDWIIIDSPPVIAVTDACQIARLAGATFLVARYAQTRVKELDLSRRRLEQAGSKVSGVIFNGVEDTSASAYYGK